MRKKLPDLADSLRLSIATLERWIIQGRIPVLKKGENCEFDPDILQKWASNRKIAYRPDVSEVSRNLQEKTAYTPDSEKSLLYMAVRAGGIYYDIKADTPEAVIRTVAGLVPLKDRTPGSLNDLEMSLDAREKIRSTGVGKGVAVPHPLKPMPELFPESLVMICFLSGPVDFSSPDGVPAKIVLPVLAASQPEHLKLLSEISLCLRSSSFMNLLESVPDRQQLLSGLSSFKFR